jgi:hypothetical protein
VPKSWEFKIFSSPRRPQEGTGIQQTKELSIHSTRSFAQSIKARWHGGLIVLSIAVPNRHSLKPSIQSEVIKK